VNELVKGLSLRAGVDVVEIEHNRISDAAIDACVLEQDSPDALLEHNSPCSGPLGVAGDVGPAIRRVVLSTERGDAGFAHSMPLTQSGIAEPELFNTLVLATPGTDLHERFLPSGKRWFASKPSKIPSSGAWRSPEGPQRSEARAE
jgi:hypothetical protein